ncbi:MAG: SUMF1/EgtB/PvdO family nonheme iron enzyme, partial [Anaerolineae bacterium]
AGRRLRETVSGTEKEQALQRCFQAGLVALLAQATADEPEQTGLLADIFEAFLRDPDVDLEMSMLLRGSPLDVDELAYLFADAGYDPETLPGLDFGRAMRAFEAAYLTAAADETLLQGTIQTEQMLEQTRLQRELLDGMHALVAFLRQARPESVGIRAGKIEAENVVSGVQIVHYWHRPEGEPPAGTGDSLRTAYLNRVFETTRPLYLGGVDPKAASDAEAHLHLNAVYTALLTRQPEDHERLPRGDFAPDREERRLSALAQLDRHRRLVLLGDPGSGKSTLVNFVAMCLAGESLGRPEANLTLLTAPLPDDEGDDEEERQPWSHSALLPVRVILRDFAARGLPPAGQPATAEHLWAFIEAGLEAAALGDYAPHLRRELLAEGGLLLLDGLDEVPEARQRRAQIKQVVEDFARTFHKCRVLVTSRTYAYQQQDWRLPDFSEAVLAPFSAGQIRRFVDRWYAHVAALRGLHADDAQGRAEVLKRAIFASDRLQALAERPLLLTLMASLHAWRGGSLPENREELYADTVTLLLDWWESQRVVRDAQGQVVMMQPSLAEWLKVDREKVRGLLNALAYQAHAGQSDLVGTADIPEGDLVTGLMHLRQNPEVNPAQLVEYLSQRAGLLVPRGVGVYTFPHRTFQEYLAACHLTDHDYPDVLARLTRSDPNRWREVALLAGAKAARGAASTIWLLADALCHREPQAAGNDPADAWGGLLAGQALVETADLSRVSPQNQAKVDRVRRWQVHILRESNLPAVERAAAGDSLAHLGDSRFRPDAWYLPDEPLLGFVEVPAGPFWMGSDKERDSQAFDDETSLHEVTLPDYYIARYPVTVAQFQDFVEASGHKPQDPDRLKGQPNRPVVWVTWYDALEYCEWLTERLRGWEGAPEPLATLLRAGANGGPPWRVTLPSEAEWEKAARGPSTPRQAPRQAREGPRGDAGSGDGRIYPWGDEPDPNRANYGETGIGATSAVGCFPGGASVWGIEDLSGNVWEWTRSLWGEDWQKPAFAYPYDPSDGREDLEAPTGVHRVLRGGSFLDDRWDVRCAYRVRGYPGLGGRLGGFRVVVSPFTSEL